MLKFKTSFPYFVIVAVIAVISGIQGHGMMLDPVSRSSRWRYDKTAPINYDDNGLFCGGFGIQWNKNNGKCGICGDDFAAARPRDNELGGKYGQGVITKQFSVSQMAHLGIKITTNHLGFFYFNICNLDKFKGESEECFSANKIKFSDGSDKMYIGKKSGMIYPTIVLPKGLTCKHCVLRWNYQAGNNWGPCGNGTSALGCGPQENFKGCSDISIIGKSSKFEKPLPRNWLNFNFKTNNYLDYVVFEPKEEEVQPKQDQALDWDKYLYEPFEDEQVDNEYLDRHSYEPNEEYDILYKLQEEMEEDPLKAQEDQFQEKGKTAFDILNGIFEFDKEESVNNALDDGPIDFEDF